MTIRAGRRFDEGESQEKRPEKEKPINKKKKTLKK